MFNKMKYELWYEPYVGIPFEQFSKEQAEEYFQCHMSQVDHRIEVLARYVRGEGFKIEFDYSPESLIPLWEWYEGHIVLEKKSRKEYRQELKKYPEWVREDITPTRISMKKTMVFGSDIAIYFGEVVCKNSDGKISWGYFTGKKFDSVNRPVLMGFIKNMYMDPQTIIYVCTIKDVEKRERMRLLNAYEVWQRYIA